MINELISESLIKIKQLGINVYTYSLYFSHEDGKYSICIDTLENSNKCVNEQIKSDSDFFEMHLSENDYEMLELSSRVIGRNTSLGDYKYVNIVSRDSNAEITKSAVIDNIHTLRKREYDIIKFSSHGDKLLLSVTSIKDEFGICWHPRI